MRTRLPVAPALPEERDGFKFRSGHAALDLAATLAARHRPEPRELLATPGDLDRWLRAAAVAATVAPATPADLRAARALREGLYRLAAACIAGHAFAARDRALVNVWSARALPAARLGPAPGRPGRVTAPSTVREALAAIARDAVELYSGAGAARIRQCGGCSILFVDASRAGRRRWCSMAACGNKDKVAAHRRRVARNDPAPGPRPSSTGKRSARGGTRR
jgi:predicted RNA-binding Zn ribbon-like protein